MAKGKNAKSRTAKRATARESDPQSGSIEAGVPPTRAVGQETATGQAIREAAGEEERLKGDDRGSPSDPGELADPKGKPKGMQAKPAIFTSNGEIPRNVVPTASGLQPISTVANTQEEADKLIEKREEDHARTVERGVLRRERLDEATVGRLGRAELRAIGETRGYDMPISGTRATRAAFLKGQEEDELVEKPKKASTRKR